MIPSLRMFGLVFVYSWCYFDHLLPKLNPKTDLNHHPATPNFFWDHLKQMTTFTGVFVQTTFVQVTFALNIFILAQ